MIAVIVTRAIPDHLRGYVGRFLIEVVPGVFAGKTSLAVAERLWHRVTTDLSSGSMAMIVTDKSCEQGFFIRTAGQSPPSVLDLDGLELIEIVTEPALGATEGGPETTSIAM